MFHISAKCLQLCSNYIEKHQLFPNFSLSKTFSNYIFVSVYVCALDS